MPQEKTSPMIQLMIRLDSLKAKLNVIIEEDNSHAAHSALHDVHEIEKIIDNGIQQPARKYTDY